MIRLAGLKHMFQNPEDAFGGTAPMLGLIDNIYAAVQTPSLWPAVMEAIALALGGESIALFAGFPDTTTPDLIAVESMAASAWADFANYYASINPIMQQCEQKFAVGTTWLSNRAVADSEFEKTEFCNDFFQRNDMFYSAGIRLALPGSAFANLSCQRSKRQGAFGDSADIVFQTLKPHLQRALLLHRQMSGMQTAILGLETALDAHEHAVLGLDATGRVTVCNPRAQTLLAAGDGLRLAHGTLCCALAEETHTLQSMLTSVLAGGPGGAMLVHGAHQPALRITVSPFRASVPGHGVRLAALIFLSDPSQASQSRAATLRALYSLTPTECRVADLLLEGWPVRELAPRLHISLETARFHVKRIFAKTGARRQGELVRLMLALPCDA